MVPDLSEVQRAFVEEMGNLYAGYGWKRLDGLILGLLLATDSTLSLDDITEALARSKGPVSEAVRQLAAAGMIRKVQGSEHRRDYYAIDPEVFHHNHLRNMQTVRRNRAIAERFLGAVRDRAEQGHEGMRFHLQRMHAFYTLMESFYNDFSVLWRQQQPQREERGG